MTKTIETPAQARAILEQCELLRISIAILEAKAYKILDKPKLKLVVDSEK